MTTSTSSCRLKINILVVMPSETKKLWDKLNKPTKVLFVLGPPGVGKSVTLLVWCLWQFLKEKKTLVWINIDDFKLVVLTEEVTFFIPFDKQKQLYKFTFERLQEINPSFIIVDSAKVEFVSELVHNMTGCLKIVSVSSLADLRKQNKIVKKVIVIGYQYDRHIMLSCIKDEYSECPGTNPAHCPPDEHLQDPPPLLQDSRLSDGSSTPIRPH